MESSILEGLNSQQKESVLYTDGSLLIMAGAGSGKTKVLTHKVAYLHKELNIPLQNILAVTFTNKAAREMLERIEHLCQVKLKNNFNNCISTFHSLAFKLLHKHCDRTAFPKGFIIYDSSEQLRVIKKILANMKVDPKTTKPNSILSAISKAKSMLKTSKKYAEKIDSDAEKLISAVYETYQKHLTQNSAMDFDDLLINLLNLFKDNDDLLEEYQQRFQFILVDEYQDINTPQYLTAYLLSKKHKKLFVVGDSDQNIYSWRGANIQNILNFEKDFPNAKVVLLEQNYRSTKTILDVANSIIKNNKMRQSKNLWTENDNGENINCYIAKDEYDEAKFVGNYITNLVQNNVDPQEIAVLYRANAQSRVIEEKLIQNNIKYKVYGGFKFYERKEIKDILAYLRLIYNPNDNYALERIINTPSRKIGKLTIERLRQTGQTHEKSMFNAISNMNELKNYKAMEGFKDIIVLLQQKWKKDNLTVAELLESILFDSGYKNMLEADSSNETVARLENIYELISSAKENNYNLEEFLSLSALLSSQDESNLKDDSVTLMTLHSAKGLEYNHVFLSGFEEKVLPHFRSLHSEKDLEEERRLCYVGITRAKKSITISASSNRAAWGNLEIQDLSRFFFEIPKEYLKIKPSLKLDASNHILSNLIQNGYLEKKSITPYYRRDSYEPEEVLIDFKEGDLVSSTIFGKGTIIKTFGNGNNISLQIKFNNDIKLIMPKYGKLEKIT